MRDHFDELHDVNRVEEMHANHACWPLRSLRDTRHRERRCVGREDRLIRDNAIELLKERALYRQVFDDRFDDEVRVVYRGLQVGDRHKGRGCGFQLRLRYLASRDGTGQVRLDAVAGRGERVRIGIGQPRVVSRHRGHLRDAMAHCPRSDDGDAGDLRFLICDL